MNARRLLTFVLAPFLLVLAAFSFILGVAVLANGSLDAAVGAELSASTDPEGRAVYLLVRLALLPCQLLFIALVTAAALWVIRRRNKIARWATGEPLADRLATYDAADDNSPLTVAPARRDTLRQSVSSLVVILALATALLLSLGQFIPIADLAVVVTALTGSLSWGARLPISDLLGGISNLFEGNFSVGDHIRYNQLDKVVEGRVEAVDLRYAAIRADAGELITVPNGELRVFRNLSRGDSIGVYVTLPIPAERLPDAQTRLAAIPDALTPELADQVQDVQVLSRDGVLGPTVSITVFARTQRGRQQDLELDLYAWLRDYLAPFTTDVNDGLST